LRKHSVTAFRRRVLRIFALAMLCGFFIPRLTMAQQRTGANGQSNSKSSPNAAPDATLPATDPQQVAAAKLSDFAWLEGRWHGDWGPRMAEQTWMAPKAGMMVGLFRLVENGKPLVIELFTLVQRPDGINFYFRHFTPELVPWEKTDATLLNLTSLDATHFEFDNPVNGMPKHAVFTRIDADTYVARSELVPQTGDSQTIEITYHREPAISMPNGGNGARQKKP
jgi:Domain of unknown function (DUF6265)